MHRIAENQSGVSSVSSVSFRSIENLVLKVESRVDQVNNITMNVLSEDSDEIMAEIERELKRL